MESATIGVKMNGAKISNKLDMNYDPFPDHDIILKYVREGEALFRKELQECGLSGYDIESSQVHSYDDIEAQAFFQAIPSMNHPNEIVIKSFLTYGAHFMDDLFDRPDRTQYEDELYRYRKDFMELLDKIGPFGTFAHRMAQRSANPEFVYKGIHRMLYGGLIQLSEESDEQDELLKEYKELGMMGVSEDLKHRIRQIRDITYWMTTKVVQEIFLSAEPQPNFTTCELWNLVGAPVIYLHDNEEEEENGELNFFEKEKPKKDEMIDIINFAIDEIFKDDNDRMFERYLQVKYLNHSFSPVLSDGFIESYQNFEDTLFKISHRYIYSNPIESIHGRKFNSEISGSISSLISERESLGNIIAGK